MDLIHHAAHMVNKSLSSVPMAVCNGVVERSTGPADQCR